MNINTKSTNLEMTPDIRTYLDKRLADVADMVDKYAPHAVCDVEVGKTTKGQRHGDIFHAEINLDLDGQRFRATAEKDSINAAIDKVKKEMLREIRRSKRKEVHLLHRGGARLKEMTHSLSARGARLKGFILRDKKRK